MFEFNELSNFDECLSWIDVIVSLCRSIDSTCSKLDCNFPCEENSNDLVQYIEQSEHQNGTNSVAVGSRIEENHNKDYEKGVEEYIRNRIKNFKNCRINEFGVEYDTGVLEQPIHRHNLLARNNKPKITDDTPYGIIIRGRSKADITSRTFYRMYQIESEVIKKLNIGDKICVYRAMSNLYDMEVEKNTYDFDYLLDMPFMTKPDTNVKQSHYKSEVAGVYWDKRSWIASWYVDGKRFYKSFSSKLYGFYRSKYFAIQTRLSNIYFSDLKTG